MFWQALKDLCEPPLHVGLGGVKLLVGLQVVLQHIVGRALAAPVTDLEILQISMTTKKEKMDDRSCVTCGETQAFPRYI